MITFTLYSQDHQNGLKLAEVRDESMAFVLTNYFKGVYSNSNFRVTIKYPRKKEVYICGNWS